MSSSSASESAAETPESETTGYYGPPSASATHNPEGEGMSVLHNNAGISTAKRGRGFPMPVPHVTDDGVAEMNDADANAGVVVEGKREKDGPVSSLAGWFDGWLLIGT